MLASPLECAAQMLSGREITDADREAWLAVRATRVGASEVAAAIGVSPFMTPVDLYLEKLGITPPREETRAMRLGRKMEPIIADEYEAETGARLARRQVFLWDRAVPVAATLDAIRDDGRPVEMKYAGSRSQGRFGESGTDEVPPHYICQAFGQMAVSGADAVDFAVLFGDHEFRTYTVQRDDAVMDRIMEQVAAFWERVQRQEPPEIDPEHDRANLAYLYPEAVGETTFDAAETLLVEQWEAAKHERAAAEKDADRLKAEILGLMGDAGLARLADGRTLKRSVVTRKPRIVTTADVLKAGGELLITKGSTYANLYLKGEQ